MSCRLCKKTVHNARRCPKNPEAGNKVNAHIKRAKTRKRKDTESASTSVVANDQAGNRNTRVKRTATAERTVVGTSGHQVTHSVPTHSQASHGQPPRVATQPSHSQARHGQAPRVATQPSQSATTRQARQRSTRPNRLAHLMFGDNY